MKNNIFLVVIGLLLLSCLEPTPRKPIIKRSGSEMEKSVILNKKIIEFEEHNFKEIIRLDSINNYITSSLGFWYKYLVKSERNDPPKTGEKVLYTYEVFDSKGLLIYSENEVGLKEYVIDKQEIVEGLRDGLKLMNEGEQVTFLFPSYKLYGYAGDNIKIGINQSLIYKVKLIKINKKNESI